MKVTDTELDALLNDVRLNPPANQPSPEAVSFGLETRVCARIRSENQERILLSWRWAFTLLSTSLAVTALSVLLFELTMGQVFMDSLNNTWLLFI
jgi:hypothetical protein